MLVQRIMFGLTIAFLSVGLGAYLMMQHAPSRATLERGSPDPCATTVPDELLPEVRRCTITIGDQYDRDVLTSAQLALPPVCKICVPHARILAVTSQYVRADGSELPATDAPVLTVEAWPGEDVRPGEEVRTLKPGGVLHKGEWIHVTPSTRSLTQDQEVRMIGAQIVYQVLPPTE
jgi:hypothetical protein